jgi:hypothetical protein
VAVTVVFSDTTLERAAEDRDFCPEGWSAATLTEYRRRVHRLDAAHSIDDLLQLGSIGAARAPAAAGFIVDLGEVILQLGVIQQRKGRPILVDLEGCVVRRKETSR